MNKALLKAAETHAQQIVPLKRQFDKSEETSKLEEDRSQMKQEQKEEEWQRLNKAVGKSRRTDKLVTQIKYLEEEVWHDIKKARNTFLKPVALN